MTLLSLPTLTSPEIYVIGDVIIHDGAVVAAGSILQAQLGYQIVIEAGACIGMGTVINASEGEIFIGQGVILGTGVLIVGSGRIGNHACIGSASTLWNTSIEALTIVPPGSLLGDRSLAKSSESQANNHNGKVPATASNPMKSPSLESDPWAEDSTSESLVPDPPEIPKTTSKEPVVGQVYINQMLYTLFPGRQPPS